MIVILAEIVLLYTLPVGGKKEIPQPPVGPIIVRQQLQILAMNIAHGYGTV